MKTIEFFKEEIPNLIGEMNGIQITLDNEKRSTERAKLRRQKKVIQKRIDFLKFCRLYIETNPNPDFVKGEAERLANRINMYMETYVPLKSERHTKAECSKHKRDFEKEMGIPKLRTQLLTLHFINN